MYVETDPDFPYLNSKHHIELMPVLECKDWARSSGDVDEHSSIYSFPALTSMELHHITPAGDLGHNYISIVERMFLTQ